MLQNLHVKNLALIDEAEVEFSDGLNILTGETGAGKSIVLGSVNLALGGRYTADLLRKDAQYGLVELTFSLSNEEQLEVLRALGIVPEDGQLIISRRLMEGRSISRINGETVTIALLKAAASVLIDIHGQHEHQSLLYKKNHLRILDAFAKEASSVKQQVKEAYREYQNILKELSEADTDEAERLKESAFLRFEIEEIQNAQLTEEEADRIEESYRKMVNGKKIVDYVQEAYAYTGGDGANASENVSRAVRALQCVTDYDGKAEELYAQLMDIDGLLNDFNRELSAYAESFEFSQEEFYETESRLNEINHLKSKYGNTIEEILSYCSQKEERLQRLEDYDNYLDKLRKNLSAAERTLSDLCEKLSKIRKKEAEVLKGKIREGLLDLNFLDVQFEIQFDRTKKYTEEGFDDIEFLISMNPGEPVKPLGSVASGGELSRIMLAIKAVLADKDEIETLIFDEIDVGISGRTAQKVSEKMAFIGKKHQVICITHLAQIAAMADSHYVIEKEVEDGVTKTRISKLSKEQEIGELARILGGAQITDTVLENAREMKNLADGLKD